MFKEVGSNMKTWAKDVNDTYLTGAIKSKDPIKVTLGPVMALLSTFNEALDNVAAGVVDTRLSPSQGGFGRTGRDGKEFLHDVTHLRPIRAVLDVVRLPGDLLMDIGDVIGGFRNQTRHRVSEALAA